MAFGDAAVMRIEIKTREPYANGRAFDGVGVYERVRGKVVFAVDPRHAANQTVIDLELAPRNTAGLVEFSTDVELLVRTYDMLDLLPRPQATVEFTQKTMATIKLSDFKPDITQAAWYKRLHLGLVAIAGAALLAVTGILAYAGTTRWMPTEEDLLLRDLQVIQNLDEYSQIGQFEFLERLQGQPTLMLEISEEVRSTHGR